MLFHCFFCYSPTLLYEYIQKRRKERNVDAYSYAVQKTSAIDSLLHLTTTKRLLWSALEILNIIIQYFPGGLRGGGGGGVCVGGLL